jgi:uncharacterized protein YeaO (DUF488 family)
MITELRKQIEDQEKHYQDVVSKLKEEIKEQKSNCKTTSLLKELKTITYLRKHIADIIKMWSSD